MKRPGPNVNFTSIRKHVGDGILRFQGHVGQRWNGLVLKILKVVSYFLLAISFRSY